MGTLVSESKSFVFIHIPKTAGISLSSLLEPYSDRSLVDRKLARSLVNLAGNYTGVRFERYLGGAIIPEHASLAELASIRPSLELAKYHKFAVVRNPWDRLASLYTYHLRFAKSRYLRPGYWRSRRLDFASWLRLHSERKSRGLLLSQSEMLRDPVGGGLALDSLLRFETLSSDFSNLATELGLEQTDLPRLNKSENLDYRKMYSDRDAELVAAIYEDDIELFGYSF